MPIWNTATLSHRVGQKAKAFRYTEDILDKYEQSDDAHVQEIAYSARNLICNLLLADTILHPDRPSLFAQHLREITTSLNATPRAKANAYFALGNLKAEAKEYDSALVAYRRAR